MIPKHMLTIFHPVNTYLMLPLTQENYIILGITTCHLLQAMENCMYLSSLCSFFAFVLNHITCTLVHMFSEMHTSYISIIISE